MIISPIGPRPSPSRPRPSRRQVVGALAGAVSLALLGAHAGRVRAQDRLYWPTYGWRQVLPAEVGIDPAAFDGVTARLQGEAASLSSLVVVLRGNVVYEYTANGFTPHQATDIWSSTKSITSTAIGIAIDDGLITLDDTLGQLIPTHIPSEADPSVVDITVRNLLTMRSGWLWDGTVDYANLDNSADWAMRTLTLPIEAAPGELFTYNSGNTHLLSVCLQEVSGQTLQAFSQARIFGPMGVEIAGWRESDQGETAGGWGLSITPREMAKYGYLMLNGGVWDGERLVSENWVVQATQFQSDSTGINDFGLGTGYGYGWWLCDIAGYPAYFSLGYGESVIYVVPDLDVVVAAATDVVPSFDNVGLQSRPQPVIREAIVPSVITW